MELGTGTTGSLEGISTAISLSQKDSTPVSGFLSATATLQA